MKRLKALGIKIAVGSSSKNTQTILRQIGLFGFFDVVVDGNRISKTKPDPEVFMTAADLLEENYTECMVIEDSDAGIKAARAANMTAVALHGAKGGDYSYDSLKNVRLEELCV